MGALTKRSKTKEYRDILMDIGIIGLPNSGKTTIFNALTRSAKAAEAFTSGQVEVHTAVVEVPDPRVDVLSAMFQPQRTTYATVTYNDISGFGKGRGTTDVGGPLLNAMASNDALMLVTRAFASESVPHPVDSVDPMRDLSMMESELVLSDMTVIDKRLERLGSGKQRGTVDERKRVAKEQELLVRLMGALEDEKPLREVELSHSDRKTVGGFGLLSLKPLLRVINGGERDDAGMFAGVLDSNTLFLRGQLEAEIAQMTPDDSAAFLAEYGIEEPGLNRAVRLCYRMSGRESFFTVDEDEVCAWTMRAGTRAVDAAGLIHSDLQRGFIRAETISYNDLAECGSLAAARSQGKLRLEGKEYVVQDGDVLTIRYNV